MITLTDEQRDVLTELVNIGVGHAASTLNSLTGHHISLVVPEITIVSADSYHDKVNESLNHRLSSISMGFAGSFDGNASLMFPIESASILTACLTDERVDSQGFDELRTGTLSEVGNILLNSIMGSISNMLDASLNYSVPEYFDSTLEEVFTSNHWVGDAVILARTFFSIDEMKVEGHIFLFFKISSFKDLLAAINKELEA